MLKNDLLISVIIPTYNREDFLIYAIDSVMKQTYKNFELIIVDDGSSDGTYNDIFEKYEKFLDKKIFYFYQENKGVSSARNFGIEKAKGDYICFLDSDDQWKKNKLETQLKTLINSEYKICYTNEIWLKNEKRINQKKKHQKYSGRIFKYCLPLCIISASSVMINKSVFEKVGRFDETMIICEDYDLWLRISAIYNILLLEESLIIKCSGNWEQLSFSYEAMDKFRVIALEKIFLENQKNNYLSKEENTLLVEEIINKCNILSNGYRKRDNVELTNYYKKLIEKYNNFL